MPLTKQAAQRTECRGNRSIDAASFIWGAQPLRDTTRAESKSGQGYVAIARDGLLSWLEEVRSDPSEGKWGRWKYHTAMAYPWSLNASAFAILILDDLGELKRVSDARRAEAVAHLQSCQDPDSGLFKDPLETEERRIGTHTWEQIWGQRHGASLEALSRLNAKPVYDLPRAQFVDFTAIDGRAGTLSLSWVNPWRDGESWARAIQARMARVHEDDPSDPSGVDSTICLAFDAFEELICDPDSGMPSRMMEQKDASRAMAGLFKSLRAYCYVGRPYPHACRAIDTTLSLQHDDGEFGYRDNMCINWDALWVLRMLDRQLKGGYRHGDIVHAGVRLADRLVTRYRQTDGGFAFHGGRCLDQHHSIQVSGDTHPIGDMLGSAMVLKCLRYTDEWLGIS